MKRPVVLVDAFADRPFAGNPAGVMLLDAWLPEAVMQDVATEMAQAETAFAVARADGAWDLRWFSPTREVDFCGHATLATAHVLAEAGRLGPGAAFHTRAGLLRVRAEGALYVLDLPRHDPEPLDRAAVLPAVPGAVAAFRNVQNLFAVLPSEAALRAYEPDMAAIAAATGPDGLAVTAPGEGCDFVSRYFWPTGGIPEDPVTGSTHATLVPFWAARLGRERLEAVQASRRGGRLACRLLAARVEIAGPAVTTLHGMITLPDRGS